MKTLLRYGAIIAVLLAPAFAAMVPLTKTVGGVELPLYVLRRASDKAVLNQRALSNTTGLPNAGTDQEYLPILIDEKPNSDPLYTVITQVEAPNEAKRQWEITYVVSERPMPEKLASIDNVKRFEATKHVPPQDFTEMIVLTLAAILRESKGLVLTEAEEAYKNSLIANAVILKKNADNAAALKAAAQTGAKPDVTGGWEPVVAKP